MNHNLTDIELTILRNWGKFNAKILKFQSQSSAFTFEKIFGKEYPAELDINDEDDKEEIDQYIKDQPGVNIGYKLYQHFRFDCNHDYQKFQSYLTNPQINLLLVYIVRLQ